MGLPPPKLQDLAAWIEGNPTAGIKPTEVWEIGVPAKNSLSWSIVLSVLLSASEESFPDIVKKLTGDESEVKEIKGKKKLSLSEINADKIKQRLRSFNPFKNRHNIFHWVEISEVVRIFDLRLKRYANRIKSTDEWNDNLKLKAVSRFLGCKIEVYFPETREFSRYQEISSTSSLTNVILFEYKDQKHGARRDPINIFNFSMELQQVHNLKLGAVRHFLKKAKIAPFSIGKIIELLNGPSTHGTAFLPTIIEKGCIDILPEIYQSPYIALKLSEAGFETDPIARITGKPSPLCCVLLCNTNPAYLRILYDYASNCRSLFDRSLRRADDTVLNNLRRIKSVVESDISILDSSKFERHSTERALHILKQLNQFIEYQSKIVNDLTDLKNKLKSKGIKTSHCRKEIINVIAEQYLKFFQYENESDNISQQLSDFVHFTEYYDFTDNFFYISFFDNFFKLKLLFGLIEENVLSSHVEGKMCLAIKSNKYFPTYVPLNTSVVDLDAIKDKRNGNILRHIPLHYRNVVQSELVSLLQMLKNSEDSGITEYLKTGCNSYPEIIDEVLISRLNKYLEAVQEISPETDGMVEQLLCRHFLVIERAMQVIGESIKPPSSLGSIASFLLRSCLPTKLQTAFIRIRNDLSKYRCSSVYGKLKIENDKKVFEGIKNELKQIQDAFEIVNFTQHFRIEESVMNECLNQLRNNLELNEYEKFREKYEFHLKQRTLDYAKHHRQCIELLLDSLSDLQEQSKAEYKNRDLHMRDLFGQLKSIEYLLEFIGKNKNEKYLNDLLKEVQNFSKINEIKHNDEIKKLINNLSKWKDEILKHNLKKDVTLFAPNIESFFESMKRDIFSEDERKQITTLVEKTLQEARKAKYDLECIFGKGFNEDSIPEVDKLLEKIPLPDNKLAEIRSCYKAKKSVDVLLKLLRCLQEKSIKDGIKRMIETNSLTDGYAHTVLTKIVFQRNSNLSSPGLPDAIYEKLENFLASKVVFFLNRAKILKNILIDDDEEIKATWKWGRSEAIKHHLKFLMRQRYMRETTVCASLEMADFDLLNIVHEPLPYWDEERDTRADPDDNLATLYEKSTNLFAGFDLRNLLSHRNNIPEVIGEALDKDDFPSEMIEKFLKLINDSDAIEAMLELFKKSGVIERKTFELGIKESNFPKQFSNLIRTIKNCDMWGKYIPLFPLVKTGK